MIVIESIANLRSWRSRHNPETKLGLVPTMGALHEGHLSIMRESVSRNSITVATIFVNPTQFSPGEDIARYPKDLESDIRMLTETGVDAVFAPRPKEMYYSDASIMLQETYLSRPLCGQYRPGHFQGVALVVAKILNLVQPSTAYFGQKDYQQLLVIKRMVRDLNFPVEIAMCPTVRERDGLAMSSRNRYLSHNDRQRASAIYTSLEAARRSFNLGERNTSALQSEGISVLTSAGIEPQYWEIRNRETLEDLDMIGLDGAVMAVAAFVGTARLIDNLIVVPE